MISFGLTFGAIVLGTVLPVYVAVYLVLLLGKRFKTKTAMRYLSAIGLGILLYFFVDVTIDATELGVNTGFSGGASQLGLVLSFIAGTLVLTVSEYYVFTSPILILVGGRRNNKEQRKNDDCKKIGHSSPNQQESATLPPTSFNMVRERGFLFLVPALVALGIGVHGAGEGSSFAFVASSTTSDSLINAFGGYGAVISYVLHKFLEGAIAGSAYFAYVIFSEEGDLNHDGSILRERRSSAIWQLALLGSLIWIPTLLGTAIGYFISVDPIYFYAFASGASIYVALRLAEPLLYSEFDSKRYSPSREKVVITVLILVGFLILYFAALFHSTTLLT